MKVIFHRSSQISQILLRIAIDVDDARFVTLGDAAFGRDEFDQLPKYACRTVLCAAADADIPALVVDNHSAIGIGDLAVHFHISDRSICQILRGVVDFQF